MNTFVGKTLPANVKAALLQKYPALGKQILNKRWSSLTPGEMQTIKLIEVELAAKRGVEVKMS